MATKQWRDEHKALIAATHKKWVSENRDKLNEYPCMPAPHHRYLLL